ncbi:hypothetical protein BFW01_g1684 [Lasiodiplodia theobromae]|nr:hypothetical protein BFW01_g1684 [Lasiodiplodia theobromae]
MKFTFIVSYLGAVMLSAFLAASSAQHHSTYNEGSDLTAAVGEAVQPVAEFETKIRPAVDAALRTLSDTISFGIFYGLYDPEWFEQEAAAANRRQNGASSRDPFWFSRTFLGPLGLFQLPPAPGSTNQNHPAWTGADMASKMHWESVCETHDRLHEVARNLVAASSEPLDAITAALERFGPVEQFVADMVGEELAIRDYNAAAEMWGNRSLAGLLPPELDRPPVDVHELARVNRYLEQTGGTLLALQRGLLDFQKLTLSSAIDEVTAICNSRDARGVSVDRDWDRARTLLHDVWKEFELGIAEWYDSMDF